MKILHKIATSLGITPYTLDDIVEKAQKTGEEVIITATKDSCFSIPNLIEYRLIAIIGEKSVEIKRPEYVYFNYVEEDRKGLKHEIITGKQAQIEKILYSFTKELKNSGINARYIGFNKSY